MIYLNLKNLILDKLKNNAIMNTTLYNEFGQIADFSIQDGKIENVVYFTNEEEPQDGAEITVTHEDYEIETFGTVTDEQYNAVVAFCEEKQRGIYEAKVYYADLRETEQYLTQTAHW